MITLNEWREDFQADSITSPAPMEIVQNTMAKIAPLVQNAYQQIENWPNERDKQAARRTLDSQLLRASREQWFGTAKRAVGSMNRGMDATKAMRRFGNVGTAAANQLMK